MNFFPSAEQAGTKHEALPSTTGAPEPRMERLKAASDSFPGEKTQGIMSTWP